MLHSSVLPTDHSGFIGPSWQNLAGDSSACMQKWTCRRKLQCLLQNNGPFFLLSRMKTKHPTPYYLETEWPMLFLFYTASFSKISVVLYGCPHTFVHKYITKSPFHIHTILKNIMFTAHRSYSARLYFVHEGNMSLLLSTSFVFLCVYC